MAICRFCGKEKSGAASCLEGRIVIDGTHYVPVPYRTESGSGFGKDSTGSRCPECQVAHGGFHHVGCMMEQCPKCGNRWVYCRCNGTRIPKDAVSSEGGGRLIYFPGTPRRR